MRSCRLLQTFAGTCSLAIASASIASAQQLYRITDLGVLGRSNLENYSAATAMNASGQVTGSTQTDNWADGDVAFLWNGSRMVIASPSVGSIWEDGSAGGIEINNDGQVVGSRNDYFDSASIAFRSDGTTYEELPSLGGWYSYGRGINAAGHVVGDSTTSENRDRHPFLWDGVSIKDLGTFGGRNGSAVDINAAGRVTGWAETPTGATRAFLWTGTRLRNLGTLGGASSEGVTINVSGLVAGWSDVPGSAARHAFLWNGTSMLDLGTLGGSNSSAQAINADGQVTGSSEIETGRTHAFLWADGKMLDLGVPDGGVESYGSAINDNGHVTGSFRAAGQTGTRAFIWDGTSIRDLHALVDKSDPLKPFVELREGVDINGRGQIAANGWNLQSGEFHAFLVTPMEYQLRIVGPASESAWARTASIPFRAILIGRNGKRITDARAQSLVSAQCAFKFSATGSQPRSPVCMKYDATTNEFYFNWKPGATAATGSTTLRASATYKFSMPQTITTTRSREIAITQ